MNKIIEDSFKVFLIKAANIVLRILYVLPIDKKSILLMSYNGSQFSCNPKYIAEYIRVNYKDKYKLIWVVNDKKEFLYIKEKGYQIIKYNSFEYLIKILTAKVIITNIVISNYIPIRKKQFLVNTWHGGGAYKKALYNEEKISKSIKSAYADQINLYISSCNRFSELIIRKTFNYDGAILESGLPRNDIFFLGNEKIKQHIKDFYDIDHNKKILLYAPTYRDLNIGVKYDLDVKRVLEALTQSFGGDWVLFVRAHHATLDNLSINFDTSLVIDTSKYPDMQELLYTADVLITDYSSSIWDFSIMKKPCFLYATDLDFYKTERDFYIDINKWHFPLSQNNNDLIKKIMNFNVVDFNLNMELHHKEWGSFEDGKATQRIVETIISRITD